MSIVRLASRLALLLAAVSFAAAVPAQEDEGGYTEMPEVEDSTSMAEEETAADVNPQDLKPRAAEMAPLASQALLLALTRAGDKLVAVGDRGIILLSDDGEKWRQVASPVHATLTSVAFADATHGWVGGHDATILRTADGGETWQLQNFQPELSKPVLGLYAADAQRAYAVGAYGLFLATNDGGATWTPLDAPPILEDGLHLNSLIRLNNGELFVVGEIGLLGVSKDGATWERLTLPYEGSVFGALPRGPKGALVYGLRGNVFVTDDVRSDQWRRLDTGTVQSMFGGAAMDGGSALVGADGAALIIGADGRVARARGPADAASLGGGTLSGVLPWKDELLVVGELGVGRIKGSTQ